MLPNLRTVAYAEIEAFACENLLARMEGGQLDAAPIWSDLKSFPWEQFSGLVDILTGGYPCQPFSAAGKRAGADDPRHLWPFISAGIEMVRPRLCFFENVEGHITLGLREVIADLESLGYETAWGIFSAAECGAPHQRKRVFILANDQSERVQRMWSTWQQESPAYEQSQLPVRSCPGADWSDGTTEPILVRMADGGADWMDRVRLLGNGVVPATAALAFRTLLMELTQ